MPAFSFRSTVATVPPSFPYSNRPLPDPSTPMPVATVPPSFPYSNRPLPDPSTPMPVATAANAIIATIPIRRAVIPISKPGSLTYLPAPGLRHDAHPWTVALLRRRGGENRAVVSDFRCNSLVYGSAEHCGMYDPELRMVLELASDEDLFELEGILFGPSYFSPLLKSMTERPDMDYSMDKDDIEEREVFISHLESRFLFLAADAHSTLRGWRPSYRNVLLCVRKKLHVPCSSKLSTEDLEAEIFLHLLNEYSSHERTSIHFPWDFNGRGNLEMGLDRLKVNTHAALKIGVTEVKQMIMKGGGIFVLGKVYQSLGKRLSGKMLKEAANYQIKYEIVKKSGQLAATNLESRTALLAARMGFADAASRYLGFRKLMMLLGPMLWGIVFADLVWQMLGTDYARILRAIYALAQIRLTQTHGWKSN